jgi:ABC-type uncharacterized transport system permease subunit
MVIAMCDDARGISRYDMPQAESVWTITVLGGYLLAAFLTARSITPSDEAASARSTLPIAAIAALVLIAHGVLLYGAVLGHQRLDLNLSNTLSLLGWLLGAAALIALTRTPLRGLAAPLLPIAGLCALVTGLGREDVLRTHGWLIDVHIVLALVASAVLTVAAVLALLMAIQDHRLRTHRPGGVVGMLPPLETMERILFGLIGAGFGVLSLALFSGLIFVEDLFSQHLAHKTILSIAAWLVFALLLLGRWRFGWRGRTAVNWTLGGFGILALAYFGSRIVLELVLGRHWG